MTPEASQGGPRCDRASRRAWIIFGILCAVFLIGLVITSFWGGPFESDSYWRQTEAPTYPG